MAKIQRIGNDHQAPFWHIVLLVLFLLVVGNEAVTGGKNKLPHEQYTLEPTIFTNYEPPLKLLIGGLTRCGPDPPNPPYGGAKVFVWGVVTEGSF